MNRLSLLILIPCLALGCGGKSKSDGDTDTGDAPDTTDLDDGVEGDGGPDVPEDPVSEDMVEDDSTTPPPEHVLKYLGRYEHQADGPDHLMGSAILDAGPLVVASATGVAVVDRTAIEAGTVSTHMGKYLVDTSTASNLDDAPTGSTYFPKFFNVATRSTTAYVTTRFDGLWIFDVTGSGTSWSVSETRRHMRAREFTESVQVVGDNLFLTHHADGIEVMDLSSDPTDPTSIDTLGDPLVDSWGISAQPDGKIWVADGAGGVKYVRFESGTLSHVTGDTVTTAPGTVFDVAVIDTWVIAAVGGQGITVYEEWTAAQRRTFDLDGVCVDVEPMGGNRFTVACRGWVHVLEMDSLGIATLLASARLHRRAATSGTSVHIGSQVTADGDTLYVSGWDHVDVYEFMATDPDSDADIQLSGQRAHFGHVGTTAYFLVSNAGQGTLSISSVDCADAAITCPIDSTSIAPGGHTTLRVIYDGSGTDVQAAVRINSNDPDDPEVPILVFAQLAGNVDPLETAPDFTGTATLRDYTADTFTDSTLTLSDFDTAGEVVHFAIFGSW